MKKISKMVLVLAGGGPQWDRQEISCRETWANPKFFDRDTLVYFVRGNTAACFYDKTITRNDDWENHRFGMSTEQILNAKVELDHHTRTIHVDVPDGHAYSMFKFGAALLELRKHYEWDYLVRPNTGSYVNLNVLSEDLKHLPKHNLVFSLPTNHWGIEYGSGACFTITNDLSEKLVQNVPKLIDIGRRTIIPDDAIIGSILMATVVPAMRADVTYDDILEGDDWFKPDHHHHYFMSTKDDRLHYHVHRKFYGESP